MKKLLPVVGLLAATLFFAGGCAMHQTGQDRATLENPFKLVPRAHHEDMFPGGHGPGGERNCFYSEYDDAYLCPYAD